MTLLYASNVLCDNFLSVAFVLLTGNVTNSTDNPTGERSIIIIMIIGTKSHPESAGRICEIN